MKNNVKKAAQEINQKPVMDINQVVSREFSNVS